MLDPKGRKDVLETLWKLNREFGISIVLITHFMEEAADADRVIIMNDGGIRKEGRPDDVFSDLQLLSDCGLELPGAARLASELRDAGIAFDRPILTEQSLWESLDSELKKRGVPCRS